MRTEFRWSLYALGVLLILLAGAKETVRAGYVLTETPYEEPSRVHRPARHRHLLPRLLREMARHPQRPAPRPNRDRLHRNRRQTLVGATGGPMTGCA